MQGIKQNQFVLHYQPKYRMSDGEVIGSEALLRWEHPKRGLVLPDGFIPVAEQTGLINELGHWVLQKAISAAVAFNHGALSTHTVAINVSTAELSSGIFINQLSRLLKSENCRPNWLEIEITESESIVHSRPAMEAVTAAKELGVSIAIDDFGTGYSSLVYLKQVPASAVKIDRSFIADISEWRSDVIVCAIIEIAHKLGLSVIAEGVETDLQCNFLAKNNCDAVQGYLYSKPVPYWKMETLLHASRYPVLHS